MAKTSTGTGANNEEIAITIAALGTLHSIQIESVDWSTKGGTPDATLTIESPSGTVKRTSYITAAGVGFLPFSGSCFEGEKGEAVVVRLSAPGADIASSLNVAHR